jgi:hypothetical protein
MRSRNACLERNRGWRDSVKLPVQVAAAANRT